jgi:hypothetical protein
MSYSASTLSACDVTGNDDLKNFTESQQLNNLNYIQFHLVSNESHAVKFISEGKNTLVGKNCFLKRDNLYGIRPSCD